MSRKAEILKGIVKKNPEPARGKSGTDPMDPWNAKSGLAESSEEQLLKRYLKSRGINPDYIPKDTKIAHSKSTAYLSWRKNHEFDESVEILEAVDKEDTITFDIPLLIRMFEYAREDAKDDMALHKVTEKLISIRDRGTLTMADYDFITALKEHAMVEGAFKSMATDQAETKRLNKMSTLQKFRADAGAREKKHDAISKNSGGMTSAIDRLEKHMNKEEVVNEMDTYPHPDSKEGKALMKAIRDPNAPIGKPQPAKKTLKDAGKILNKVFKDAHKKDVKENTLDPQAATQAPVGPGECGCDSTPAKERSKSARIIKSIYKRKNMKEETYDWEKDDKNTQVYGKKPKLKDTPVNDNVGENKPDARAILSGGKTLTGDKRDVVEIDPFMKKPKDNTPDYFEKPIGKKDK